MTLERTTRSSPDLEQAVGATTRAMSDGARKLASSTKGQTVTESPPLWVEICRVLSVSKENRLDTPFSSFRPFFGQTDSCVNPFLLADGQRQRSKLPLSGGRDEGERRTIVVALNAVLAYEDVGIRSRRSCVEKRKASPLDDDPKVEQRRERRTRKQTCRKLTTTSDVAWSGIQWNKMFS